MKHLLKNLYCYSLSLTILLNARSAKTCTEEFRLSAVIGIGATAETRNSRIIENREKSKIAVTPKLSYLRMIEETYFKILIKH